MKCKQPYPGYECIVYKVEVYNSGPNNNNSSKQVYVVKKVITMEVVSCTKYTDIRLVFLNVGN